MKHLYTSGADHLTFEGLGGGGVWLILEKISYRLQNCSGKKTPGVKKPYTDFAHKKNPISCQCIEICVAP